MIGEHSAECGNVAWFYAEATHTRIDLEMNRERMDRPTFVQNGEQALCLNKIPYSDRHAHVRRVRCLRRIRRAKYQDGAVQPGIAELTRF